MAIESEYFTEAEQTCRCGCGESDMNPRTIRRFEQARRIANIPFIISSSFRCQIHDRAVRKKALIGAHARGYAMDIVCVGSRQRFIILDALIEAGFIRIGIAKEFIHADDYPYGDPEVCWLY